MTIQEYADWLRSCSGVHNIKPVTVVIGGTTYQGVQYSLSHDRNRNNIGFLGVRPKAFRKNKICFHHQDTDIDWYVAGYIDVVKPEHKHAHPNGGPWWCISPWSIAEKIDQHEQKKYQRLPLEIQDERTGS